MLPVIVASVAMALGLSAGFGDASGTPLNMCKVTAAATISKLRLTVYNPLTSKPETTTITPTTKRATDAPKNVLVATVFAPKDSNITAKYDFDISTLEPYEFMLPTGDNFTLNTTEPPGRVWINYRFPLYAISSCESVADAQEQLVNATAKYSFNGQPDHDQGVAAATSYFDTFSGFMLAVHWFDADEGSETTCGDAAVRKDALAGIEGVSLKKFTKKCVVPGVFKTTTPQ